MRSSRSSLCDLAPALFALSTPFLALWSLRSGAFRAPWCLPSAWVSAAASWVRAGLRLRRNALACCPGSRASLRCWWMALPSHFPSLSALLILAAALTFRYRLEGSADRLMRFTDSLSGHLGIKPLLRGLAGALGSCIQALHQTSVGEPSNPGCKPSCVLVCRRAASLCRPCVLCTLSDPRRLD